MTVQLSTKAGTLFNSWAHYSDINSNIPASSHCNGNSVLQEK
jgi:hypothetical protein